MNDTPRLPITTLLNRATRKAVPAPDKVAFTIPAGSQSPLVAAMLRARAERLAAANQDQSQVEVTPQPLVDLTQPVTEGEADPVSDAAAASPSELLLFYHPESDDYFTGYSTSPEAENGLVDDLTHLPEAWGEFWSREQDRLAEEIGAIALNPNTSTALVPMEIIQPEPMQDLPDVGFDDEVESIALSTGVDTDHLRRAAMEAMQMFNIMDGVNITLDPSQVHAVHTLVKEQYGCLIGAAGTGKTTTTRALLQVMMNGDPEAGIEPIRITTVDMKRYRPSTILDGEDPEADPDEEMIRAAATRIPGIALCAFTGQATQVLRKNLPPAWRANAMTIHSLLAFAPEDYTKLDGTKSMRFVPTYTKQFKMPWDIIVVDEASMVNLDLWHKLLDAAKPGTRFYFIGDLNQLPPPVGMGILGFALAKWPVCELTVVHRQSEEAANKIIDLAHAVIDGKIDRIKFDDPQTDPNWRVIGFELDNDMHTAHNQVIMLAKSLSEKRVAASVDPETPLIYDPWRDRILTPGNGYNTEEPGYLLGQYPINDALSRIFADPALPRYVIDAKRVIKKFAVGYRVMATKNEPPDSIHRVTNGMTGKITEIYENPRWFGDRRLVGDEAAVTMHRKEMLIQAMAKGGNKPVTPENIEALDSGAMDGLSEAMVSMANQKDDKQSGPSSHTVSVKYDNGAYRQYSLNAEVEQLMIAYASTTHKAQGSEMPTTIIVVHHANRFHLNREALYTAVTRAKSRVILLHTQFGLRLALAKQKVSGRNLREKIESYLKYMGGEDGTGFKTVNVRLSAED